MTTATKALTRAVQVLKMVRDTDADEGINDPDVADAIVQCEEALKVLNRMPRPMHPGRKNRWGLRPGDPVRILSGTHAGIVARFNGVSGGDSLYLDVNGERRSVKVRHLAIPPPQEPRHG